MKNILFISHKKFNNCGVHQFGVNISSALKNSNKYNYLYEEVSSGSELKKIIANLKPSAIIFNHTKDTMPWLKTCNLPGPIIGIIHEIKQELADSQINSRFDYFIAPDPTLILKNPVIYKTGRLLLKNNYQPTVNSIPVISSFGLATENKKYLRIIEAVCKEFDEAIIRFNIPVIQSSEESRKLYEEMIIGCQNYVDKFPGIKLEISSEYLSSEMLLKFLSESSLNVFIYEDRWKRGISSALDYALSVKVPVAISGKTDMFRHVAPTGEEDYLLNDKNSLKKIIASGNEALKIFYDEWSEEHLVWDYDRIMDDVIKNYSLEKRVFYHNRCLRSLYKHLKRYIKKKLHRGFISNANTWSVSISSYKDLYIEKKLNYLYQPVNIEYKQKFNTVLDDQKRHLYLSSVRALQELVPTWMDRKVSSAVVQQGFVFDLVVRLAKLTKNLKVLCVGCFEDTAYGGLVALDYDVTGIDPVLNYDLDTYVSKPNTIAESYDVIFSTSVIEHVEDDLNFIEKMNFLLKPGGKIILTCDYRKNYRPGDAKPGCDYRLYSSEYIKSLINKISDLSFVDEPDWDEYESDFGIGNEKYCFATIVLEKNFKH